MIKPLRFIGDPILKTKCRKVEKITPEIQGVCDDILDSVKAHHGAGLAANQIGYDWRIFCLDLGDDFDEDGNPTNLPMKLFINPEITYFSRHEVMMTEPCLSIPGIIEEIQRPKEITVKAMGVDGKMFEEKGLKNWRSRCIQHELDHLNGTLFVDHFSDAQKKEYETQIGMIKMKYGQTSIVRGDPFAL